MKNTHFYLIILIILFNVLGCGQNKSQSNNRIEKLGDYVSKDTIQAAVIAIETSGIPCVAYNTDNATHSIAVMHYSDKTWSSIGKPGIYFGSVCAMTIDENNNIYTAFRDKTSDYKLTIAKYDGTNWSSLGQLNIDGMVIYGNKMSMSIDKNGILYVAFTTSIGQVCGPAYVMAYSNSNWATVGKFADDGFLTCRMAMDSSNTPYVICCGYSKGIVVMKYNNANWTTIGGRWNSACHDGFICLDAHGTPYIVYHDDGKFITVQKYNGNATWSTIGPPQSILMGGNGGTCYGIVAPKIGYPMVIYSDNTGHLIQYDGTSWNSIVTQINASSGALVLDKSNTPYVFLPDNAFRLIVGKIIN